MTHLLEKRERERKRESERKSTVAPSAHGCFRGLDNNSRDHCMITRLSDYRITTVRFEEDKRKNHKTEQHRKKQKDQRNHLRRR